MRVKCNCVCFYTHTHKHIYLYMYMYTHIRVHMDSPEKSTRDLHVTRIIFAPIGYTCRAIRVNVCYTVVSRAETLAVRLRSGKFRWKICYSTPGGHSHEGAGFFTEDTLDPRSQCFKFSFSGGHLYRFDVESSPTLTTQHFPTDMAEHKWSNFLSIKHIIQNT